MCLYAGEVGWREVEHWMWPLFTESWQRWRVEALGMPPVPFAAAAAAAGAALPPPPPLLYGLSEAVVPRPAYWPASVHMCGFWLDSEVIDVWYELSTCPRQHRMGIYIWLVCWMETRRNGCPNPAQLHCP